MQLGKFSDAINSNLCTVRPSHHSLAWHPFSEACRDIVVVVVPAANASVTEAEDYDNIKVLSIFQAMDPIVVSLSLPANLLRTASVSLLILWLLCYYTRTV